MISSSEDKVARWTNFPLIDRRESQKAQLFEELSQASSDLFVQNCYNSTSENLKRSRSEAQLRTVYPTIPISRM